MHIEAYLKIDEYTIPTIEALKNTLPYLSELAIGGTAVGTGLNYPEGYDRPVSATIARFTNLPFVSAETHGAIKQSATLIIFFRLLTCVYSTHNCR